eukprot:g2287.t1
MWEIPHHTLIVESGTFAPHGEPSVRLVSFLKAETFERGQYIIKEGEVGDKLYIIERGVCEVLKKLNGREVTVGQLSKGSFFGEIAVLYDMPRTATVRTQTAVIALALSRADITSQLSTEDLEHMKLIARTQVFGSVPLLADLNAERKAKVALALKSQRWYRGAVVAGQNHITSRMYIIEQGNILLTPSRTGRNGSKSAPQEMRLGPGQFFGMRGLLYGAPMGYTITADSDEVMTLSISHEDLVDPDAVRQRVARQELVNTAGPDLADRTELDAILHRSMRAHLVKQIPAIQRLAEENFQKVFEEAQEVTYKKWNVVFRQGDVLRYVYVLETGKLSEYEGELEELVKTDGKDGPNRTSEHSRGWILHLLKDIKRTESNVFSLNPRNRFLPVPGLWLIQPLLPYTRPLSHKRIRRAPLPPSKKEVAFKEGKWNVIQDKQKSSEYVYNLKSGQLAIIDAWQDADERLGSKEPFDGKASSDLDVNCPEHVAPGDYFGAECLSSKSARAAYTLVALTDVTLLQFPPSSIWAVQEEQRQSSCSEDMQTPCERPATERIQLFSEDVLSKDEQFMLVSKLKPWNFSAGRYIIKEGEIGDMLFIIEKGVCDACKYLNDQEVVLTQLKKGAFFGELAVMFDMPRTASVRAATAVTAMSLTREVFGSIPILARLSASAKNTIARRLQPKTFRQGDVIIDQAQPASRLYIIESGSVVVKCGSDEKGQQVLAGTSFGMHGLLYEDPYVLEVTAYSDQVKTLSCTLPDRDALS